MSPIHAIWLKAKNHTDRIITKAPLPNEERLRLKHSLVIIIFSAPTFFSFAIYNLIKGNGILGSILFIAGFCIIGSWISLFYTTNSKTVYRFNSWFIGFLLSFVFLVGGSDGALGLWLLVFPPIAIFLLDEKEGFILASLFLLLVIACSQLALPIADQYPYSSAYLIRYFFVYLIISGISFWFEYFRSAYRTELQTAHQRFTEILDNSNDILYRRDLKSGQYQYISKAFGVHLGYNETELKELTYQKVKDIIHPDDINHHDHILSDPLTKLPTGSAFPPIELRMRNKSGEYLWFSDQVTLIYDDNGKPEAIIGVNREITVQRQIKRALQESKDRFITILDSLPAHVYVADMQNYRILFMNKKMKEDFGDQLEGKICWKEFRNETGPCPHCTNHLLLDEQHRPKNVYEWECHNPLLNRWYNNYDRAIQWTDGRWVRIQIAVDISRQKFLEDERLRNAELINRAHHLDAIGTLAGGIAHDFNNLLQTILGNISLAERTPDDLENLQTYLADSKNAVIKARDLADKMLELSPIDSSKKVTLPVGPFLEQLSTQVPAGKKITRSLQVAPDLWPVPIDYNQITTAFRNIIANSYDSIDGEGKLTIIAENILIPVSSNSAPKEIPPGKYVKIKFIDDGNGIEEENITKVFEPYFSTKEKSSFKGIGLGSAITYAIIQHHNGYIYLNSKPSIGTEISIYLPCETKSS